MSDLNVSKKYEYFRLISEKDTMHTDKWDTILKAANTVYKDQSFIVTRETSNYDLFKAFTGLPPAVTHKGDVINTYIDQDKNSRIEVIFNKYLISIKQRIYYGWYMSKPEIVWEEEK